MKNWPTVIAMGLPFMLLGVAQILSYLVVREQSNHGVLATERARLIDKVEIATILPDCTVLDGELITRGKDNSEGHYSNSFEITYPGIATALKLSVDYPFIDGWHHLTGCYTFAGWECLSEDIVSVSQENLDGWPYVHVKLRTPDETYGSLYYSLFDARGEGLAPPSGQVALAIWQRCFKINLTPTLNSYFQVQLFCPGIHDEETEKIFLRQFLAARRELRSRITSGVARELAPPTRK